MSCIPAFSRAGAYCDKTALAPWALKLLIPHPASRAIFVLPGTFVHELLHLLVGVFMNGKPVTHFAVAMQGRSRSVDTWRCGFCEPALVQRHVHWPGAIACDLGGNALGSIATWLVATGGRLQVLGRGGPISGDVLAQLN
jgi:hypothetical protein